MYKLTFLLKVVYYAEEYLCNYDMKISLLKMII